MLSVAFGSAAVTGAFKPERKRVAAIETAVTTPSAPPVSRSAERPPAVRVVGKRWLTTATNLRTGPSALAKRLTTLPAHSEVAITNVREGAWIRIQWHEKPAWITTEYLTKVQPEVVDGALSMAPCASGSAVEAGLQPATIAVHRAVCAEFPQITRYGGLGGGEHVGGYALDIMVGATGLGSQIAAFCVANASELGITDVIWAQRIWTAQRASEGWRPMADRGSPTANHWDHVHVSTG